ncbi:MAG: bifunctional phosphoribosyl-AMP cyclohydrolase/phosphoribosyl-ATP diphosphatase HisIE [Bacteroidales bacterium]|jgi:phosphoribosyl-ATP pyrophosphohydrolase/phosphoribosyl-AMP cyclohydrolase|nr:bifunctional phosphoribosyl-AMP cyclohydrolase/phosphoribosyl-ATP diphosphatase HisIE [Bacteroidales bacterium]
MNTNNENLKPAIIQDGVTGRVLMMAWVNEESLRITRETGRMTFYSRSRQKLWTKGEESGNYLYVKEILDDCDNDTLLVKVTPAGPACHTGSDTCWGEKNVPFTSELEKVKTGRFISELEAVIELRRGADTSSSYTAKLLSGGPRSIAKKIGEEAAELIIESMDDRDDLFLAEAADLLYHYLVLLHSRNQTLEDVERVLASRHR